MADNKRFDDREGYDTRPPSDDPPNSRLFIVCNKNITEDDFRRSFEKCGNIEDIWVVKDRNTGSPKGVTYIKFSKTSEAAFALEEMNGKIIGCGNRPLKVMIASKRSHGSRREKNEEEKLLRLFCVVPKSATVQMLRDHFGQFGDIEYISIVKDRVTNESRGFAYVKFKKISEAAKAYEMCDRSYRAVFAEPKKRQFQDLYDKFSSPSASPFSYNSRISSLGTSVECSYPNAESCTIRITACSSLSQDQLWKLFDVPQGLDFLYLLPKLKFGRKHAVAVYNSVQDAAYAEEKLNGFEYPPGQRLIVKIDPTAGDTLPINILSRSGIRNGSYSGATSPSPTFHMAGMRVPRPLSTDVTTLAETISQASSIIQKVGLKADRAVILTDLRPEKKYDPSYCSVKLPPSQPLVARNAEVLERLFFVCSPEPAPTFVLRDVFGRFGGLIDVYVVNGRNFGYAKYANKESAEQAKRTLSGQEICGAKIKVMTAEPSNDARRKRIKLDSS